MQKRRLGTTDLELTTVGLGTWALGGAGWKFAWGPQDDRDSIAPIHKALDPGINWIDTAAVYGFGHSEEVVGRAVMGRRSSVILATKCSRVRFAGTDEIGSSLKADSVRAELEASLRRLGIDCINLYQIHWPNSEADIEKAWGEIAKAVKAVKAGKVRAAGGRAHPMVPLAVRPSASPQTTEPMNATKATIRMATAPKALRTIIMLRFIRFSPSRGARRRGP